MIWFTSDSHFCHKNIIKYCNRPPNCDEIMVKNLEVIQPDDIFICVGDFGFFHNNNEAEHYFNLIKAKTKYLITGNHDDRNKWVKKLPWSVRTKACSIHDSEKNIFLHHWPKMNKMPRRTNIFISGHTHNKGLDNSGKKIIVKNSVIRVSACVELWDYKPFSLEDIDREVFKERIFNET